MMREGVENGLYAGLLTLGAAIVVWAVHAPLSTLGPVRTQAIPAQIGDWQKMSLGNGLVQREGPVGTRSTEWCYRRGEDSIWVLLLTPTGNDRHGVHDPEYCYAGSGWDVVGRTKTEGPYALTELLLRRPPNKKLVERYVFVAPGRSSDSLRGRLQQDVAARLRRERLQWALVRFSCASDEDPSRARTELNEVCPAVVHALITDDSLKKNHSDRTACASNTACTCQ